MHVCITGLTVYSSEAQRQIKYFFGYGLFAMLGGIDLLLRACEGSSVPQKRFLSVPDSAFVSPTALAFLNKCLPQQRHPASEPPQPLQH